MPCAENFFSVGGSQEGPVCQSDNRELLILDEAKVGSRTMLYSIIF
jgi:hypothetical protein